MLSAVKKYLEINEGFKCIRKLIGQFRRSGDATQALVDATGKTLLPPSKTRWGSHVEVIERFLEVKKDVKSIAAKKGWDSPCKQDLEFLRQVHHVLKPFAEAISTIQAEKTVTVSLCVGIIKGLHSLLDEFEVNISVNLLEQKR